MECSIVCLEHHSHFTGNSHYCSKKYRYAVWFNGAKIATTNPIQTSHLKNSKPPEKYSVANGSTVQLQQFAEHVVIEQAVIGSGLEVLAMWLKDNRDSIVLQPHYYTGHCLSLSGASLLHTLCNLQYNSLHNC